MTTRRPDEARCNHSATEDSESHDRKSYAEWECLQEKHTLKKCCLKQHKTDRVCEAQLFQIFNLLFLFSFYLSFFHFSLFCFFFSIGKTAFNFIWKIKNLKQKIKHKLTFIFIEKIIFLKFFCVIFLQFLCENVWLIQFFFDFLWFSLKNLHVI